MEQLFHAADAYNSQLTDIRRDLHRYAETAWTEFRTTAKILTFLREKQIPVWFGRDVIHPDYVWSYPDPETLEMHRKRAIGQGADPALVEAMDGYTGAMAVIDSGKPGPVTGFRFDMDCNEVEESEKPSHRPRQEGFASVNPHCMHACGHDGHTAIGLILAAVLQENKDQWCGKVKIIYQPGEEGDKGAQSMVEKGLLSDVDRMFSLHIYGTDGPCPAIAGTQMGLYATTKFDVTFTGRSAHAGAAPEEGSHAILAAVHAISGMMAFCQDGRGSSRLNIGTIQGGTGRNVIPESCSFRAETRGEKTYVEKRLYEAAVRSIRTSGELFGCTHEIRTMGYGPQGNGDLDLAQEILEAVKHVPEIKASMLVQNNTGGTDDFTYMMQEMQRQGKKACYMALLTRLSGGLHNGEYDFDESCLMAGVKACLSIVRHYSI